MIRAPLRLAFLLPFAASLAIAVALTVAGYFAMITVLRHLGIEI